MSDQSTSTGGSLRMREAEELLGAWTIEIGNDRCTMTFDAMRLEAANGWRLIDPSGCLGRIVKDAAIWRPAPEGIEIAAADRRTLLVFTATGDAMAEATLPDGRNGVLRRASHGR